MLWLRPCEPDLDRAPDDRAPVDRDEPPARFDFDDFADDRPDDLDDDGNDDLERVLVAAM